MERNIVLHNATMPPIPDDVNEDFVDSSQDRVQHMDDIVEGNLNGVTQNAVVQSMGHQHVPIVSLSNSFQVLSAEQEENHTENVIISSRIRRTESDAILIEEDNEDSSLLESGCQTKFCWGDLENGEPLGHRAYTQNEMIGPLSSWYDD